jgi:hypothetical protein
MFPNLNSDKLQKFQASGNLCVTLVVLISPSQRLISYQWLPIFKTVAWLEVARKQTLLLPGTSASQSRPAPATCTPMRILIGTQ